MELINAPQQKPEEGFSLKEKILYSLGTIVIVGGSILIGRKIVLNRIANREENYTLDEGSAATYAKQIKMAFENDGWPGTNTAELRRIMIEITSATPSMTERSVSELERARCRICFATS